MRKPLTAQCHLDVPERKETKNHLEEPIIIVFLFICKTYKCTLKHVMHEVAQSLRISTITHFIGLFIIWAETLKIYLDWTCPGESHVCLSPEHMFIWVDYQLLNSEDEKEQLNEIAEPTRSGLNQWLFPVKQSSRQKCISSTTPATVPCPLTHLSVSSMLSFSGKIEAAGTGPGSFLRTGWSWQTLFSGMLDLPSHAFLISQKRLETERLKEGAVEVAQTICMPKQSRKGSE